MTEKAATYEKRDVSGRGMVWFVAAFVLVTLLLIGGLTFFVRDYWGLIEEPTPEDVAMPGPPPDAPRLQADPVADLEALRREKRALLNGYGWVDRESGVARIPIEEAMRLSVERAKEAGR